MKIHYARNPKAEFYFAGHSNGTYIIGEALERIPSMAFKRIYLAASVLPSDYQWDDRVKRYNQTDFIRSDMGTEDWPVSILCRILNKFGMKSIGTGGADGFEWDDNKHFVHETFNGGHSAMLTKKNTQSIVDYLLEGILKNEFKESLKPPSKLFLIFKKFGDLLIPLIFILLISGIIYPFLMMSFPCNIIGPITFIVLIWLIIGRF